MLRQVRIFQIGLFLPMPWLSPIVNKGITDKGKCVSRNDGAHSESKAGRFQHIDDRNTDQKPNSRSCTIALVNTLKGNFYTAVRGGQISVGSPDIVLHLCEGAKHH